MKEGEKEELNHKSDRRRRDKRLVISVNTSKSDSALKNTNQKEFLGLKDVMVSRILRGFQGRLHKKVEFSNKGQCNKIEISAFN